MFTWLFQRTRERQRHSRSRASSRRSRIFSACPTRAVGRSADAERLVKPGSAAFLVVRREQQPVRPIHQHRHDGRGRRYSPFPPITLTYGCPTIRPAAEAACNCPGHRAEPAPRARWPPGATGSIVVDYASTSSTASPVNFSLNEFASGPDHQLVSTLQSTMQPQQHDGHGLGRGFRQLHRQSRQHHRLVTRRRWMPTPPTSAISASPPTMSTG